MLGNSRIFGYKKKEGKLIIDPDYAPMVQELFELYATDNYSMKELEKSFWEKGYRNRNGNKIAHSTMSGVIANPKYKGYYVGIGKNGGKSALVIGYGNNGWNCIDQVNFNYRPNTDYTLKIMMVGKTLAVWLDGKLMYKKDKNGLR